MTQLGPLLGGCDARRDGPVQENARERFAADPEAARAVFALITSPSGMPMFRNFDMVFRMSFMPPFMLPV